MIPRNLMGRNGGQPFVNGALLGGLITYVVTNEAVQRAAISGVAHAWMAIKGGLAETQERFRDAEAQIKAARSE